MYNWEAQGGPSGFFSGSLEPSSNRPIVQSMPGHVERRGEEVSPFGGNVNPMIQVILGDKPDIWERPVVQLI